jgi:hypothetical protein
MMATELADTATHDEIQETVDQIIEDRKGDEEKTDSQKVAEQRDKPVTERPAETDSGSETASEAGEKTGDSEGQVDTAESDSVESDSDSVEWLDDDLKAEVAAYGIGEDELADFSNREELDRALRFFDRSAQEAGRKALAEGDKSQDRDGQGRFAKKESESQEEKEEPKEGYEINLDKDAFDEELVGEFSRMRDYIDGRFAELDAAAEEQRFDSLVDSVGHADLFGKAGKENDKQLQRRQDLFVAVKAQRIGLQALGRDVDLDESLVSRVARMVFAEELGKKDLKARTKKISKQSNGRVGGAAAKSPEEPESIREEMRRLHKELEDA